MCVNIEIMNVGERGEAGERERAKEGENGGRRGLKFIWNREGRGTGQPVKYLQNTFQECTRPSLSPPDVVTS
jgi:hypothetical protein